MKGEKEEDADHYYLTIFAFEGNLKKKTWETEKALQRQLEERSGIFPYQDIRKSHQR